MRPDPTIQALSIAAAAHIDRYTVRRDVTYLVRNGIDPQDAAQRVIAHRRRMTLWGYLAAPSLLWIGLLFGWAVQLALTGAGQILLTASYNPVPLAAASMCFLVGSAWAYALVLYALRSWRRAARGCLFEDSSNPWLPARRPAYGVGAPVLLDDGRRSATILACITLLFVLGAVGLPIFGGVLTGVGALAEMVRAL